MMVSLRGMNVYRVERLRRIHDFPDKRAYLKGGGAYLYVWPKFSRRQHENERIYVKIYLTEKACNFIEKFKMAIG